LTVNLALSVTKIKIKRERLRRVGKWKFVRIFSWYIPLIGGSSELGG